MREFEDKTGATWVASIEERSGFDYKGRYGFRIGPRGGNVGDGMLLEEFRWNSPITAERTIATMAEKELLRLLKMALGRRGS